MIDNNIFVFDDIIDKQSQKQIQHILFDKVRWQFVADVKNQITNNSDLVSLITLLQIKQTSLITIKMY